MRCSAPNPPLRDSAVRPADPKVPILWDRLYLDIFGRVNHPRSPDSVEHNQRGVGKRANRNRSA